MEVASDAVQQLQLQLQQLQLTAAKPLLRKFVALISTRLISEKATSSDDRRLADLAEELANIGALDVLEQSMPMETLILQHYKELL
jgi:type IV secretory pathway TraG/TraD family ATPase VirD4